jgi:LysM repeat protein
MIIVARTTSRGAGHSCRRRTMRLHERNRATRHTLPACDTRCGARPPRSHPDPASASGAIAGRLPMTADVRETRDRGSALRIIGRPRPLALALAGWFILVPTPSLGGAPSLPDASRLPSPPPRQAIHIVRSGESLNVIARRYSVGVSALVAANRLPSPRVPIRIGQRLMIPESRRAASSPASSGPAGAGLAGAVALISAAPARLASSAQSLDGALPFEWPVEGTVSSPFGRRGRGWHRGVDIQADRGTPFRAAAAGTVIASGYEHRYGQVIKIEHSPGLVTVYAHNLTNFVEVGEAVAAGQVIGEVGRTGRASNYHLHFEIRRDGIPYNPLSAIYVRTARVDPLVRSISASVRDVVQPVACVRRGALPDEIRCDAND